MRSVDDPFISADCDNRSAQMIHIESLGKGTVAVLLLPGMAALIIAALAFGEVGRSMDRATIAEREARIAQDQLQYVQGELAKRGIFVTTNGH